MMIKELLSETLMPLNPSDPGHTALTLMDEFRVSHLPIVHNLVLQGLISDTDIYNFNNPDEPVGNHNISLGLAYVNENQHIYEAVTLFSSLAVSVLPVVGENNLYLGVITQANLVRHLAELFALNNPGGVIILEVNEKDFFLTEIANIVESNDAKILSMTTGTFRDSTKLEVTLKLNKMDIEPVLQTFNRYNYLVKASFSENLNMDTLRERFDSLMKYLNI
jgi:acetoin utilization protein AcuB